MSPQPWSAGCGCPRCREARPRDDFEITGRWGAALAPVRWMDPNARLACVGCGKRHEERLPLTRRAECELSAEGWRVEEGPALCPECWEAEAARIIASARAHIGRKGSVK